MQWSPKCTATKGNAEVPDSCRIPGKLHAYPRRPYNHPNKTPLTYSHIHHMVTHMKTTLNIDDSIMARLRREAARTGRTMSELVEMALRQLLRAKTDEIELPPLPVFNSGGAFVDIANRNALYDVMEQR